MSEKADRNARDIGAPVMHSPALPGTSAEGGRVHDSVVRTLGGWVLGGHYRPGEVLPREDDMATQIGVSRTTVREAVKVLCAKGLLETKPRIGVKVRPRDDWRLLDPVVLSWHPDIRLDADLVSGLIEARRIIEPAAADFAAQRATGADLAAIEGAYNAMARSLPNDIAACCEADLAFHRAVISASHNIVLKGLIGTIEAALRAAFVVTGELMATQSKALAAHHDVLEKIRFRDARGARAKMLKLLDIAAEDLKLD
jgi:GntR family transcriptional regulator, galactonate operon transcriptional repressor